MKFRMLAKTGFIIALSVLMMLSAILSASAQGVIIKGEPDGQKKSTVIDEHFYSGTLEPNFTSDTVAVKTDSYGMHFSGAYYYGCALVLSSYKMKSYNKFTFSIDMLKTNGDFIYCGFGGEDEKTDAGKYDFNLVLSSNITALYEMGGMDWKAIGNYPLNNALTVGKSTDFAITLQKVSGKDYKVTFEILEDGETIASTDYGSLVRMEHPNGHFCMWGGQNESFELRNFKVYDSETHLAFFDDFENSSLTYGDEPTGDSIWHINETSFTEKDVFISRNAGPEFKKPNDTITAKTKLVSSNKVSKPYEISFKAKIANLEKNSAFGLFFGAEKAGDLKKATIIGVGAYDSKNASVNLIRNGEVTDYGENLLPVSLLNGGETDVEFEATVFNDYSLVIKIGGIQFKYNNIKYDGFWGICAYSSDGKSAADVKLDEVKVINNTYEACAESDLSNDFAGTRITQDGFEEYYINDRLYYIGPGVSLRPKSAFTEEPSLYFESAGPYSAFAPKIKYTDFILQFDIKMVSTGENSQWFGINFGKESYASISDASPAVRFEYFAWGTKPYTQLTANLCAFADGTKGQKIEGYHFYKDQDTKYNVMIVAKNRTVYVYFKKDSEDISKLGICRAVIPDVNTVGYVSIFGANGLSFDIFNYKLTNIAAEAVNDSGIALRESFGNEKISDKLEIEGSAAVENGAVKLSGGSIATKNKSRYYIANFTLLESNADVTIDFAGDKSLTLSKDLKKMTVNDGTKKSVIDVSKYNLANYKNLQLQLILQYDALSVAVKGLYEPADKFASPIVEYTFEKPVDNGILKWTSADALIDDISVYALDNTYKAENISHDQDPNDKDIWARDNKEGSSLSANTENNQGISKLYIVIYAVICAVIVALAVVWIVLIVKKKRGNAQ